MCSQPWHNCGGTSHPPKRKVTWQPKRKKDAVSVASAAVPVVFLLQCYVPALLLGGHGVPERAGRTNGGHDSRGLNQACVNDWG